MQQMAPFIKIKYLSEANSMWKELKDLEPTIVFSNSSSLIETKAVLTYLDAAFNISARQSYGQTEIVTGSRMRKKNRTESYQPIEWMRTKPITAPHSSFGTEIISFTDADDHGSHLKMTMRILFQYRT